jgi:multiple sugar transport system permease protein
VMIGLALGLALLLDTASARFPRFFRTAFFLPYGVPGVIASILWGFLYVPGISPIVDLLRGVGLGGFDFLDRQTVLWSIANIVTWEFAGYNMLVIVAVLQSVPRELYESAQIDGANAWQMARRVKIPMVRPALVLTTVFTIIGTLQLFSEPIVLRSISTGISWTYTPNVAAYNEAFTKNNYNFAAAQAVVLALAAGLLSFAFLKLTGRRRS